MSVGLSPGLKQVIESNNRLLFTMSFQSEDDKDYGRALLYSIEKKSYEVMRLIIERSSGMLPLGSLDEEDIATGFDTAMKNTDLVAFKILFPKLETLKPFFQYFVKQKAYQSFPGNKEVIALLGNDPRADAMSSIMKRVEGFPDFGERQHPPLQQGCLGKSLSSL